MEQALEGAEPVHRVKRGRPAKTYVDVVAFVEDRAGLSDSQIYAMRVWGGQSIDVPRAERIERCMNALRGQNLPTDGIVFPT